MADDMTTNPTGVLTSVNLGELVRSAALAIADAQVELDKAALRVAEMMGGASLLRDPVTFMPIDAQGMVPQRSSAGVFYASADPANPTKFEPVILDTRVFFGRDIDGTPLQVSMFELGFTPTFYQFVDTILEIKIAMTMTSQSSSDVKNQGTVVSSTKSSSLSMGRWGGGFQATSKVQTQATPIDATYSTKFNYAVEGSSIFRTKLVPVPPPAILEQRIRNQMSLDEQRRQRRLQAMPVDSVQVVPASAAGVNSVALSARAAGVSGDLLPDRTFTWSVEGAAVAGIALDATTGVLAVDRAKVPVGTKSVTVRATSEGKFGTAIIALS